MNSILQESLVILSVVCLGFLGLAVAYQVLFWLAGALWEFSVQAIHALSRLVILALGAGGRAVKRATVWLLRLCWEALATLALCLFTPPLSRIARHLAAFREWLRLRRDRVAADDDAPEEENAAPPPGHDDDTVRTYERALAILGFAKDEDFSQADLRDRYRRLLNAVHPDKGFANNIFAQQINEAVLVIKRKKNWK